MQLKTTWLCLPLSVIERIITFAAEQEDPELEDGWGVV